MVYECADGPYEEQLHIDTLAEWERDFEEVKEAAAEVPQLDRKEIDLREGSGV